MSDSSSDTRGALDVFMSGHQSQNLNWSNRPLPRLRAYCYCPCNNIRPPSVYPVPFTCSMVSHIWSGSASYNHITATHLHLHFQLGYPFIDLDSFIIVAGWVQDCVFGVWSPSMEGIFFCSGDIIVTQIMLRPTHKIHLSPSRLLFSSSMMVTTLSTLLLL